MLAIGNSVGDLVADTAVARAGYPGMGVASCFGSPLLNDVLGLSVALIVSLCISLLLVGQLFLLPVELQSTPPHLYRSGQQLFIFFSSLSVFTESDQITTLLHTPKTRTSMHIYIHILVECTTLWHLIMVTPSFPHCLSIPPSLSGQNWYL